MLENSTLLGFMVAILFSLTLQNHYKPARCLVNKKNWPTLCYSIHPYMFYSTCYQDHNATQHSQLFLILFFQVSQIYTPFKMPSTIEKETPGSAVGPHLGPLVLGLTWGTRAQAVTVQQKARLSGTRPGLCWKRELSVRQERCGPNWQRNTQAVWADHSQDAPTQPSLALLNFSILGKTRDFVLSFLRPHSTPPDNTHKIGFCLKTLLWGRWPAGCKCSSDLKCSQAWTFVSIQIISISHPGHESVTEATHRHRTKLSTKSHDTDPASIHMLYSMTKCLCA